MQFMQLRKEAWKKSRTSTGFEPVEVLNFCFSGFFSQLHKLHSLRRSFLHFHFISAVHIWFVSYIINNNNNNNSLPTRWYQHNILKKPDVDPKCRLRDHFDETIDHLVSGCPELAKTKYIHRHNKAAAHMHWKIFKEFGIEVKEWW